VSVSEVKKSAGLHGYTSMKRDPIRSAGKQQWGKAPVDYDFCHAF